MPVTAKRKKIGVIIYFYTPAYIIMLHYNNAFVGMTILAIAYYHNYKVQDWKNILNKNCQGHELR